MTCIKKPYASSMYKKTCLSQFKTTISNFEPTLDAVIEKHGIGAQSGSVVANPSPVAMFAASINGQTVSFDADSSYSLDGTIASYTWTLVTATLTGISPSYTYSSAGTYTVTLTVTDNKGLIGSISHPVTVL